MIIVVEEQPDQPDEESSGDTDNNNNIVTTGVTYGSILHDSSVVRDLVTAPLLSKNEIFSTLLKTTS